MHDTERSSDAAADRGRFLLLGSGEFEPWVGEAERFVLAGAPGDGSVAILPTASGREGRAVFDRWTAMGLAHYESIGITAHPLHVATRADALAPGSGDVLDVASMVFFSGGSPRYLAQTLSGSPVWSGVERLLARGGVFAGCSAGAMIAGAATAPGSARPLPFPFGSGLGLLPSTALGVHWDAMTGWWIRWLRDLALGRLAPGLRFIGLSEHTAIASDGDHWRVFGTGKVDVRLDGGRDEFGAGDIFPRA